ncbi:uncharacterized protein LOC110704017 [Chenopodium quinoa]|uniref:uncharacterized protein LOC110704017 n=1 Tax=Chenopodium quinoa TaxID=63459 RepID=UPI000B77224C|nr:uncharacterized protein LOC110704017 [Chenopodium quinoa]
MPEKMCRMSDKEKSRIAEKMSEFILLMGYNADFQVVIAKELGRHIWMSSENLGRKQCRELLYLLYMADSATLLSYTVSLGKIIWCNHLKAKRRALKRKLLEKIKQRELGREKRKMKGRVRLVVMVNRGGKKGKAGPGLWARIGFHLRPKFVYRNARRRVVKRNVAVGSRVYRLALAMGFLSFRNLCVTSEWEFWAVCLVQQVFGFWRSIAIGGGLSSSYTSVAHEFGLDVVPCDVFERLQSCFRCSSTTRYPGYGREFP